MLFSLLTSANIIAKKMDSSQEDSAVTSPDHPVTRLDRSNEETEPLLGDKSASAEQLEEHEADWAADKVAPGQELSDYMPLTNEDSESSVSVQPSTSDSAVTTQPSDSQVTTNDLQDQSDPLAELGMCGLINIGNTCYMNASLQCLRSLPDLMAHCLSSDPVPPPLKEEDNTEKPDKTISCRTHIHTTFTSLVRKLWSGQFSSVQPRLFKSTVGLLYPQFSGSRQHDSQEFLAMLLDSLHEHCSVSRASFISETFQGSLRNEVVCTECGNLSVKVEPFVFLSLPLPGAYDRIVELYYVSASTPPTVTRLAVKVCRYGSVMEDVKQSLRKLLERDVLSELLVLAEVLSGSVVRTLADSLPLDRLNSKRGEKLYMFEMTPAQDLVTSLRTDPTSQPSSPGGTEQASSVTMETNASVEVAMETDTTAVVMMEWHSCNICLEEMVDSDLLSHAQCGGTLCSNCLQSSKSHQESSGQKRITCPICSKPLSEESDFKPMSGEGAPGADDAISLLLVTVLFRSSEDLVGHPLLRHLPTRTQGAVLYKQIAKCLPPSLAKLAFTLRLTGDKGRSCSRCDFTSRCPGCTVNPETDSVLKPGDHLTVQFNCQLLEDQVKELEVVTEHSSLSLLESHQLTLDDCLRAFAQKEMLSSENSWFCPKCECQRLAERTLSVDKVPQTLIVHLKRFIYHGREGNKVEGSVSFPMELSSVCEEDSTKLQLTACICHTGTLHFGHYTAYCKHPHTGEWVYYNDSKSSKVDAPDCQDSVYMLFYQKPTTPPTVEKAKEEFDDSSERAATETLLRLFKPPVPLAPLPPPLPLKRSNSNPDLNTNAQSQPEDPIKAVKVLRVAACPW